ncbi:uncharacterized protein [Periplaneta americana]|uniref:uncharacterized protein isoform X2 n=1 Tax=Periplaneta americana TaxID=6978 RepID=UPI0037E70A13
MNPAEELDLSKENVQPLKKGRMISQLGNALLAQVDVEAHHELLRQREKYETLLRTYEGDDPLELWYEYILWVEQSFLRDCREGKLYLLLERCLTQFKDDERYLQDKRYMELWIRYIEMSTNPLEVYKKCHAHGIGKYYAYFYMAWAYELEKMGDNKRANHVFLEGCKNNAQPREDLEEAHKNFQLRIARHVLSGQLDIDTVNAEQRIALDKLKAHGRKKNLVRNVRVGDNIQHRLPGILQPLTQHGQQNAVNAPVKVFNDEEDNTENSEFEVVGRNHMPTVPRRDVINKENTLEPGPWNKKFRKLHTSTTATAATHFRPQHPSFELHEDEEVQVKSVPVKVCNALKPRKLDDSEFNIPMAVFEPEDPTKCPMYCKNKVYAGGIEFTFEELRAIEYSKGNIPKRQKQAETVDPEIDVSNCPVAYFEPPDPSKQPKYCKAKVYRDGTEYSFEELRAIDYMMGNKLHRKCEAHEDDDFSCPLAIFEPFDHTKKPMYCKSKVYRGGTEYSFEELRAIEYNMDTKLQRAHEVYSVKQLVEGEDSMMKLFSEELHHIRQFESEVDDKDGSVSLRQSVTSEDQCASECLASEHDKAHFALYEDPAITVPNSADKDSSVVFSSAKESDSVKSEDNPSSVFQEPLKLPVLNASLGLNKIPNETCDQSSLHYQSLTYNTKEALNIIHDMWVTPDVRTIQKTTVCPSSNLKTDIRSQIPVITDTKVVPFDVYLDGNEAKNLEKNGGDKLVGPIPKFDIFKDDTETVPPVRNVCRNLMDPKKSSSQDVFMDKFQALMTEQAKVTDENCPIINYGDDLVTEEDCPEDGFHIYSKPGNAERDIPYVPSPGMSEEEIRALSNTDCKENTPPSDAILPPPKHRNPAAILQPSEEIPFDPSADPAYEELSEVAVSTDLINSTCNTQAFSCPLPSSTPHVNQWEQLHSRHSTQSRVMNNGTECALGSSTHRQIMNNLSTVFETTEYRSSGSSGSSGASTHHTNLVVSRESYGTNSLPSTDMNEVMLHRRVGHLDQGRGNIEVLQEDLVSQEMSVEHNRQAEHSDNAHANAGSSFKSGYFYEKEIVWKSIDLDLQLEQPIVSRVTEQQNCKKKLVRTEGNAIDVPETVQIVSELTSGADLINCTSNTQAFSYPLVSSTPHMNHWKQLQDKKSAQISIRSANTVLASVKKQSGETLNIISEAKEYESDCTSFGNSGAAVTRTSRGSCNINNQPSDTSEVKCKGVVHSEQERDCMEVLQEHHKQTSVNKANQQKQPTTFHVEQKGHGNLMFKKGKEFQSSEIVQNVPELDADLTNITCNTQAFSCHLVSSTPHVINWKQFHSENSQLPAKAVTPSSFGPTTSSEAAKSISNNSDVRNVSNGAALLTAQEHCSTGISTNGRNTIHANVKNCEQGGNQLKDPNVKDMSAESHHLISHCNGVIVKSSEKRETILSSGSLCLLKPYKSLSFREKLVSVKSVKEKEEYQHKSQKMIQELNPNSLKDSVGIEPKSFLEYLPRSLESANSYNAIVVENQNEATSPLQEKILSRDFSNLELKENNDLNPFDHRIIAELLAQTGFSATCCDDRYTKLEMNLPRFKAGGTVSLGKDKYSIEGLLGKGSYAKVYKAINVKENKTVAMKVQKPSWEWEFYICHEIQLRLSDPISALAFMDIKKGYLVQNGSIMITDFSDHGDLLSVINTIRQEMPIPETLMLYWMVELLNIAEKLQECKIIHGDIKPDNFILRTLPSLERGEPSLQLIDMGRGIDMTLFPPNTTFKTVVTTKSFQCIEMQTGRPWTYQTDLYGIAATMHCICFVEYMEVSKKKNGKWFIQRLIPRNFKYHIWEQFFSQLLNVESCDNLPDLAQLKNAVKKEISSVYLPSFVFIQNLLNQKLKKRTK